MKYNHNNNIIVMSNYLLLEKYDNINIKKFVNKIIIAIRAYLKICIAFVNKYYFWRI